MSRRGARASLAVAALLTLVVVAGCTSPAVHNEATGTVAGTVLGPNQTVRAVGARFQVSSFLVTIGDAVYDSGTKELKVGLRFENIGDDWATPEPVGMLRSGGRETTVVAPIPDVPAGASIDVTGTFDGVTADPFADGEILWGRDIQNRPRIDLRTMQLENAMVPTPVQLDAWGRIGLYTVHLTGARVMAGTLGLNRIAPAGERVLRFDFDLYTNRLAPISGFGPRDHLRLLRPDGSVAETLADSDAVTPLSWTANAGNFAEFPVKDPASGDYAVLLNSITPTGFALHPELIERVAIPVHIDAPTAPPPKVTERLPRPDLTKSGAQPEGDRKDVDLPASAVLNAGGFVVRAKHLRFEPQERTVAVDVDVSWVQTESNRSTGLLSVPRQFDGTTVLASKGRLSTGAVKGNPTVEPGRTTALTFEFTSVDRFDPDDAGLYVGRRGRQASAVPLGPRSNVVAYPPPLRQGPIDAPTVTSGDWTIDIRTYRLGLVQADIQPPTGQIDFEVVIDATVSETAKPGALGLRFRPQSRLFLTTPDGYLIQGAADSGTLELQPGESRQLTVTFHVPDTFNPTRVGFAFRSKDEMQDLNVDEYVETTFGADIGAAAPTT